MNSENIFEVAARSKFRFQYKGMLSVEEIWDLSTKELDSIFKVLNSELKKAQEESLLEVKTQQDKELDMKIEIVKYIVKVKLDEDNARLQAKDLKEQKQRLMQLIAEKKDENLRNKTPEELEKMLNELG